MRGLNWLLNRVGALGGKHFLEFTWSKKNEWWNLHCHTVFWAYEKLDGFSSTSTTKQNYELGEETLLRTKTNRGRMAKKLLADTLGF